MNRSFFFFLLFVISFSCSNSDELEDYLIRVETDKNSYAADTSTTIYLYVRNSGELPVYYECRGVIKLYEYENGDINNSWTVHGAEFCGVSTMLPNTSFTIDLNFLKWKDIKDIPNAKFDETVRYNLVFYLYKDNNVKQALDNGDQTSNYFKIIRD